MTTEIKLIDSAFAHATSFGNGDLKIKPNTFDWYRGNEPRDICFFTDSQLSQIANQSNPYCKVNVAWLLEPPSVSPSSYEWIKQNYNFFDYVLTYNKELLSIDKRFVWYPHGGCWIEPQDFRVYPKSSNVSIIASNKSFTEGHRLRHESIALYKDKIDLVCGGGYQPFGYKLGVLNSYRYSIVIENGRFDTYFSEKLIDCFVTGTIPIYWGCSLKGLFDEKGILYFNNTDELGEILDNINRGEINYKDMLYPVRCNFETAKQYTITEDWIFKNFIERLL